MGANFANSVFDRSPTELSTLVTRNDKLGRRGNRTFFVLQQPWHIFDYITVGSEGSRHRLQLDGQDQECQEVVADATRVRFFRQPFP